EHVRAGGGTIVATRPYDAQGTTTFQEPIEAVAAAEPEVVFVPIPDPPTLLTLAPQLFYYGIDDAIVLGSGAWGDPDAIRRLEPFAANYRVLGLWVDRTSDGTPWQRFEATYERRYRESLRGNLLPALAHDAVRLVLAALETARLPVPAALAAALERRIEIIGATGRLLPDPATSTVGRPTQIRMLLDGRLLPADRTRLLGWLDEARARAAAEREDDPPR
ncbi:MAG: ABC transporter substrate-binding protein, partial [Gemmatimonadota bacterium]